MNNNTFIHKYLKGLPLKDQTVVDMTCGNGNDTLFLAKETKEVLAIDIAPEAIANTQKRCQNYDNIRYLLADHQNIDQYLNKPAYLFIFNLGYLPNGNRNYLTKTASSLNALKKALSLCNGYLIITFYRGHQGGNDEYLHLITYLQNQGYRPIESYRQYRHGNEPLTLIYKMKSS